MRLGEFLLKRGLTQYALSKKTGISQGAISEYVSGKKFPGGKALVKLALALNCTVDDLLGTPLCQKGDDNECRTP